MSSWISASSKRKLINQFVGIAQVDRKLAEQILNGNQWNVEAAIEHFFVNRHRYPTEPPKPAGPSQSEINALNKLFDSYADSENRDRTSDEGILQLFEDLKVNPADVKTLMMSYMLQSSAMGVYSRKEFTNGFGNRHAITHKDMKIALDNEASRLQSSVSDYDEFYSWLFKHVKENEDKKTIQKLLAIQLWGVVLDKRSHPLRDDFCEFVENSDEFKAVTADAWINVRKFLLQCKNAKTFENDGAWPLMVDSYLDTRAGK